MKLIAGLGNPGAAYARSRHNVGFVCADLLAERHNLRFSRQQSRALIADGQIAGEPVKLVKPQTYMNLSGESIIPLLRFYKLDPADLIVIYDDLDLTLGRIRIRASGSAGGHNGIKSIIAHLGADNFPRVRIGIGRPAGPGSKSVIQHVLSNFSPDEQPIVLDAIARAADAVEVIVAEGVEAAMNRFNAA